MDGYEDDDSFELVDRGDDRPGVDEVDDDDDVDDDEDDDLDDDDDDEDDYDLDDATEDDVDVAVSVHREEGRVVAQAMDLEAANDLDVLISQLSRLPGDAGAVGFVALDDWIFVAVRVRGRSVQVLLSDGAAAEDWPLARDVADYLDEDDLPDDDDDPTPFGDLGMFSDLGMSELDVESLCTDDDMSPIDQILTIAKRLGAATEVERIVDSFGD
ncbi:tRNA adenosine deaminase-associated protein [Parenemella sanctibonifatiensis]|uniref:tRNA adenosine deaminase n=1 Tax=Parenemella sanctibonifatiensis TaxID=2016505 RepID=A0A255ECA8_9ACTN|nr:tRNA adenosine deaminase-associated protein [Parenemella sanctibonifatiensis]OYN89198.1 tRNA adenosine deaminase [Parenemella sanctibonifatiensis]